jgi:hypothetical protein
VVTGAPRDTATIAPETSADYTIVSAEPAADRAARASAREKRYQELLRSAPPSAASQQQQQPQAPPPSLVDRVVAPIASALGIRPKPQAPPAQPRPERRAETPKSNPQNTTTADPNVDPNDPDTDTVPPVLLSVAFAPTEIQDGEETVLTVVANDNLSGVRSVSGVIASPSGSMQGFACTRVEGTNQFVTNVRVAKDAPAGIWQVRYLTILDTATNSAHLNAAQGALPPTAKFTVSSPDSDAKGPQLQKVWLEREAMRAGDRNTLFVLADDEKTGVQQVSGVFVSPSRTARLGFGCKLGGTGAWECQVTPPTCLDCGTWKLEQVQLQDKANNMTSFRGDNPAVSAVTLNIAGERCDSVPPVVTQFILSPTVISNAEPTTISVKAVAFDEGGCGVASLSGLAIPPGGIGGQRRYITFDPSPDGENFTGKLEMMQFAAKGQWTIAWLQALDKGHNLRQHGANEPVVARSTFRVE